MRRWIGKWPPLQRVPIGDCLDFLSVSERRKMYVLTIFTSLVSLLDLFGILLIGLLGSIAITGIQSQPQTGFATRVFDVFGLETATFQAQVGFLGLTAVLLFLTKTIVALYFSKKTLNFLANKQAVICEVLVSRILSRGYSIVDLRGIQTTLHGVTVGIESVMMGILGGSFLLITDVAVLVVVSCALIFVQPLTATCIFAVLLSVMIILHNYTGVQAHAYSLRNSQIEVESQGLLLAIFQNIREIFLRGSSEMIARQIRDLRMGLNKGKAELQFIPLVNKYAIESSILLGALAISAWQFIVYDAQDAVKALALFLAAGSRIAPSVLRVQQSLLLIKSSQGYAKQTLDLMRDFLEENHENIQEEKLEPKRDPSTNFELISVRQLSVEKSGSTELILDGLNLSFELGKSYAIVGPSGAGKSTLLRVLTGTIKAPLSQLSISGFAPGDFIRLNPGFVSLVPQEIKVLDLTLRENVLLGIRVPQELQDQEIRSLLKCVGLEDWRRSLPKDLETRLGDESVSLSGGELQKLGLARALITNPKLLLLDELTSQLDADSENEVSQILWKLKGATTIIMVAHRLSSIRWVDKVIYLEKGKVIAQGTFNEMIEKLPDFRRQAEHLGMRPTRYQ